MIPPPGYPQCHPSELRHAIALSPHQNITMSIMTPVSQGTPTPGHHLECPRTRSHVSQLPFLLPLINPILRLTCPTCQHSTCFRQNTNCLDPFRHTQASQTLSYGQASLSHLPQLMYSHWSIATSLRDIQTRACMWITRVSWACAEWSSSINTFHLSLIAGRCAILPPIIFFSPCPC
jgi:hypothetical protein